MSLKYVNKSWISYEQHYCFKKFNTGRKYHFDSNKFEKNLEDYYSNVNKSRKLSL